MITNRMVCGVLCGIAIQPLDAIDPIRKALSADPTRNFAGMNKLIVAEVHGDVSKAPKAHKQNDPRLDIVYRLPEMKLATHKRGDLGRACRRGVIGELYLVSAAIELHQQSIAVEGLSRVSAAIPEGDADQVSARDHDSTATVIEGAPPNRLSF